MDIQHLNCAAFAVYISGDELRSKQLNPAALTENDTDTLLGIALSRLGRERGNKMCLELFPGRDDLLMVVTPVRHPPLFFAFSDIDGLFAAAEDWRGDAASSLWYIGGHYVLAVWPWDVKNQCGGLCEFGEALERPPEFEIFLAEHANTIASPDALGALRRAFASVMK